MNRIDIYNIILNKNPYTYLEISFALSIKKVKLNEEDSQKYKLKKKDLALSSKILLEII